MNFAPPGLGFENRRFLQLIPRQLVLAVSLSLLGLSVPAHANSLSLIDTDGDWRDGTEGSDQTHGKDRVLFELDGGKSQTYDSLLIDYYAPITNSQFTLSVTNGSSLTITGNTVGRSYSDDNSYIAGSWERGTYLIYSRYKDAQVQLQGDVDLVVTHSLQSQEQLDAIGANLLYARNTGVIEIGQEGIDTTTRLWVLAGQPDLISAKDGGQVIFHSTKNQLVGSLDVMDSPHISDDGASLISITFSGEDSYWVGDERSWQNSDIRNEYANYDEEKDVIDLTFKDGAQWIYLGLHGNRDKNYWTIPKRISSVTLDGGIINLYDDDIKAFLSEIGLMERLQNEQYGLPADTNYDYVRIGQLKGNGGIFRVNLTAVDKSKSDMIYIESGEGRHLFQPHNLNLLESITPENTLTFALVGKGGSGITFEPIENLQGETLFDYELEIRSKTITQDDLDDPENAYWDKTADIHPEDFPEGDLREEANAEKIDMTEFLDGTNWYIRRVILKESAAAVGMTGAGYASYDAAVEMDRRDRRLAEQVRNQEQSDNGLWVRVQHGKNGAENQYRWDRTGATLGFDRQVGDKNRVGAYFSFSQGDTEFLDVRGDGEMKRYELALFDTLTLGQSYFDFVGRIGHISSDFSVGNASYSTSGSFDQNFGALSAEYGYQLRDDNGVFVEPQLQLQVTYVDGYSYQAQRGMRVEADDEVSVIARAGLRAGREFSTDTTAGSLYARADIYHQFTDGQDALLSDNVGHRLEQNWGDTDTWASIGLGTSWVWANHLGLQVDIEKVTGGKTDDTWLMSGRINYLF